MQRILKSVKITTLFIAIVLCILAGVHFWGLHAHQRAAEIRELQRQALERAWSFEQGDIQVEIDGVARGFTTGESTTERGLLVKTSDFLLIKIDLYNSSSNRIYDYTTFRDNAILTDNKGNSYLKNSGWKNKNSTVVQIDWIPPYPHNNTRYVNSTRIHPSTGFTDELAFDVPNSTGDVLYLQLHAENFGGTNKIQFEIPVSRIVDWQ
jgi:hypothetical protein